VRVTDKVSIGGGGPLALIAGPCVIESEQHIQMLSSAIAEIAARLGMPYVFKASFDKANRSSVKSYRGPGMKEGLRILKGVRDRGAHGHSRVIAGGAGR
jgi:2-dehydro-3-deoxyphosphooctonate aldolase (KDO 8-P synthase)